MKRIIALLLSLTMVLTLAACGEEPADTDTTPTTTAAVTTTTAADDTVTTTSKLGPHTSLKPTTTTAPPTTTTTTEPETDPLEDLFMGYMWLCHAAGPFASPDDLSPSDFLWSLDGGGTVCGVNIPAETEDKGYNEWGVEWLVCTIKVADLDNFTNKIFGRTYDYTNVQLRHGLRGTCTYDAATASIVYDSGTAGAGGGGSYAENLRYTTTDKVHYTVTYEEEDWDDETPAKKGEIKLKLVNGVYQILSHTFG